MAHKFMPLPCPPIQLGEFFLEDRRFPAVYFLYDRGEVVYVGQSKTLKWRIETHLSEGIKQFDSVAFIRCTIDRLMSIEGHYIRKLVPRYNHCGIAWKQRKWSRLGYRGSVDTGLRSDKTDPFVIAARQLGIKRKFLRHIPELRVDLRPCNLKAWAEANPKRLAALQYMTRTGKRWRNRDHKAEPPASEAAPQSSNALAGSAEPSDYARTVTPRA